MLNRINKPPVEEKRRRFRKRQHIETLLVRNGRLDTGMIENLSHGGAFLSVHDHAPPGSEITLSFPILNFEFPIKLNAEVVWITTRGMGVRFKHSLKFSHRLAEQKLIDALKSPSP